MKLTTRIRRAAGGGYIGTAVEIPGLAYRGATATEIHERLAVLEHVLESPNVKLVGVESDGNGVILTLDRHQCVEQPDDDLFPLRREPLSRDEAIQLLS